MTSGFAKLIDLIAQFWQDLKPWVVIDSFEMGVVLRLGGGPQQSPGGRPYARVIGPGDGLWGTGLHPMWPFLESILVDNVVPAMATFPNQVFTSADGTTYLTQMHVLWRIDDIVTFMLDIEDGSDVLADAVAGTARRIISSKTDAELLDERLETQIAERCRTRAKRFGVGIPGIYISELAPTGLKSGVLRVETGAI